MIVDQVSVVQLIFIDIYQRIKRRCYSAGPIINYPAILGCYISKICSACKARGISKRKPPRVFGICQLKWNSNTAFHG